MLKNRIVMGALAGAAAIIPLAGMTAFTVATATSAGASPPGITCKKLSGTVNMSDSATVTLSKCTGNTGTKGTTTDSESSTKGTITWANGKVTKLKDLANTGGSAVCPSGDISELSTGKVKSDTTGDTAKKAADTANVCFAPASSGPNLGTLSLAPGTKYTIAG